MKLAVFSLAAILSAPVAVYAADVASQSYNWSGFYAGVQIGGRWAEQSIDADTRRGPISMSIKPSGVAVGGYAGYNHQFGNVIAGIEASIAANTISSRRGDYEIQFRDSTRSVANLNARLGYAIDRTMIYGTAGYARADYNTKAWNVDYPANQSDEYKFHRNGWSIGIGAEYALTDNLIGRAEYRHYDFGKVEYIDLSTAKFRQDTATLGFAYKF